MGFEKLQFNLLNKNEMVDKSKSLYLEALKRRSVREFSNRNVPLSVLKTLIKTATSAPSGANKQPWHFVIVQDFLIKKEIRVAAENEEKTLQLKALNELLENLQTEEASLIEQIKVLQTDLKELFEQYEALDCLSNPTLPECLTLEVQIKDLDAQLAALTDQAKEKQTEIKEIQAQINNIEAEIEENNALIEELTVLINKTTDQLEQLQALFCDDSECIIIEVIDTNGNPIAGYPLVIDGGNIGQTDSSGTIVYSIPNASVNTQHTLEICYCFETAGDCRQQHITITVQGDECAPTCENPTPACSDITISETITGVIGSSGVPNPPAA